MGCQENVIHTVGVEIFVLPSSPAGGAEQPAPLQGGCRAVAGAAGADKAAAGADKAAGLPGLSMTRVCDFGDSGWWR